MMEKKDEEALRQVSDHEEMEPIKKRGQVGLEEPSNGDQLPPEFLSPKAAIDNPKEHEPFSLIEAAHDEAENQIVQEGSPP